MTTVLDATAARVIAALVEKSISTPDYYPMTVNGLRAACNQKSQRNPAMELTEGAVGKALRDLETLGWVARDSSSARAEKWRQQFQHQFLLKRDAQAVLVTLMLRGPQTVAELRANAAYLGGPATPAAVDTVLADLQDRSTPLVCALPRQPGQAAPRWMHLLCGEPDLDALAGAMPPPVPRDSATLEARVAALEARVNALEAGLP